MAGPRVDVLREGAPTPSEVKSERDAAAAEETAARANTIIRGMAKSLAADPSIAGFTGFVTRAKELIVGNLNPGADQPARDFNASLEELRGLSWKPLLNDIRLAKDDRVVLERMTSGTNAWSTPQDAANTLDRIQRVLGGYANTPMTADDIAKKHGFPVEKVRSYLDRAKAGGI